MRRGAPWQNPFAVRLSALRRNFHRRNGSSPMTDAPNVTLRTRDLDQAIDAVTNVYCPHTVRVLGSGRRINAALDVVRSGIQPLVRLSYSTPVSIDAGNFPRLFLMMRCSRGSASARQGSRTIEWREGQTLPFSAGVGTTLNFDTAFEQNSVRLDIDRLESLCSSWLGRPLVEPIRFAFQPFSDEMERTWRRTLDFIWSPKEGALPLTPLATASVEELVVALILHGHRHNYSEELVRTVASPTPGVVRHAEDFIRRNADAPITVEEVARDAGISIRSLQAGFREWCNTTPRAYLRQIRLDRVREELLRPTPSTRVTETALRWGFAHLGRFSAHYKAAFGETPLVTLRRRQQS
jgi:AraC-like DNA-binding protein